MANVTMNETSDIVQESLSIVNEVDVDKQSIYEMLQKMDAKLNKISSIEEKLERFLGRLETVEKKVSKCEISINGLNNEFKSMKGDYAELEGSVSGLSNIFDAVQVDVQEAKKDVVEIKKQMKNTDVKVKKHSDDMAAFEEKLQEVRGDLEEDILDLKCRSMRDNLLFIGIPEEEEEDCEELLTNFVHDKMRVRKDIEFERVHRIGRKPHNTNARPRNIVAKFSRFKDRELVRRQAPLTLKGSNFYVQEQFPPEVEQRRKSLYPVMREARRRKDRVKLVRDRLFINGIEYFVEPPEGSDHEPAHRTPVSPAYGQTRKRPRVGSS